MAIAYGAATPVPVYVEGHFDATLNAGAPANLEVGVMQDGVLLNESTVHIRTDPESASAPVSISFSVDNASEGTAFSLAVRNTGTTTVVEVDTMVFVLSAGPYGAFIELPEGEGLPPHNNLPNRNVPGAHPDEVITSDAIGGQPTVNAALGYLDALIQAIIDGILGIAVPWAQHLAVSDELTVLPTDTYSVSFRAIDNVVLTSFGLSSRAGLAGAGTIGCNLFHQGGSVGIVNLGVGAAFVSDTIADVPVVIGDLLQFEVTVPAGITNAQALKVFVKGTRVVA